MANNRSTITLSEHLGVTAEKLEKIGVLNTNLGIDMKLFIDPKLIKYSAAPELADAPEKIKKYFDTLLKINTQAVHSARLVDIALRMIAVSEPKGLSIGYGDSRDTGTSIPLSVARSSLRSLNEMLSVGFKDITVMEMLGLFISRFGSDSISDLIAHIIYEDLCEYTQRISNENGFATTEFDIAGRKFQMPVHPFKGTQIIFVPLDTLSHLPLATTWEEIAAAAAHNARVRKDFNDLVGKSIKRFAAGVKRNPALIMTSVSKMRTLVQVYSEADPKPYDVAEDPSGYLRLNAFSDEISGTLESVTTQFTDIDSVHRLIVDNIVPQYRRQIEELGANKMLYKRVGTTLQKVDDTAPIHEEGAQVLFHIVADQICQESNVMLSRESKTAPGAVDFSLGTGYADKVVVEIKKSNNKNLLEGYTKQVTAYEKSEAANSAVYVVVIVSQKNVDSPESQLSQLKLLHAKKIEASEHTPELCIIDGRIHDSASKR
jgi:hypothetical protein